jgi:hypothetical protein
MFFFREMRQYGRSYSAMILILITISSSLVTLHLYRKDKYRQELIENIPLSIIAQSQTLVTSISTRIEKNKITGI